MPDYKKVCTAKNEFIRMHQSEVFQIDRVLSMLLFCHAFCLAADGVGK